MNTQQPTEGCTPRAPSKVWLWVEKKSKHRYAWWYLGAYSFLESSPILLPPTDIFLGIMVLANKARALMLALFTTITSTIGGIAAYVASAFFFQIVAEPIIVWMGMTEQVAKASLFLNEYTFLATILGALTPFPYTPVAFAAGFLQVHFFTFVVATFIGRMVRYGALALIVYFFGMAILPRCGKYANRILGIIVIGAVVAFVLYIVLHTFL
ncbi:hypothetical protein COU15_01675 [Candidatus Kaiserbacteria bacterium CG10_big_fil_rev_8_21_14_0_10_45_20]|uniref:VTT domain-containing protein n=1 Tax=Candidatus Kaiserbacteria bacterium CG10_big_fil_rev_8_21_14_0_10_45_20 TaxID=1974607 RepID=A0A2H0UFS6_9BACT|nr:MAG: hypothetical protein COU15_01675 [Candidatus Kaiserbacteria bacterium CG10_big_fil_rev_8_21_14_0_10_45_20]